MQCMKVLFNCPYYFMVYILQYFEHFGILYRGKLFLISFLVRQEVKAATYNIHRCVYFSRDLMQSSFYQRHHVKCLFLIIYTRQFLHNFMVFVKCLLYRRFVCRSKNRLLIFILLDLCIKLNLSKHATQQRTERTGCGQKVNN